MVQACSARGLWDCFSPYLEIFSTSSVMELIDWLVGRFVYSLPSLSFSNSYVSSVLGSTL